jgi:hypothetical protein
MIIHNGKLVTKLTDTFNEFDYLLESIKDLVSHSLDVLENTPEDSEPEDLNKAIDETREKLKEALGLF